MKTEKITSYFNHMKNGLLKVCSWILDAIGLTFSLPGIALIYIGTTLSDWADTLKEI